MAQTHTWHPGSDCVKPRWSLEVPLLPDELFSSWLIRAALKQGCDPLAFSSYFWPYQRVWTQDIDRGLPLEELNHLSQDSGISQSAFITASLRPIASRISKIPLSYFNTWPWILALGARNRHHRNGLQYCPICLAKDKIPYYRLSWRLAWHTVCTHCGSQLMDRCPQCGSAIEPHKLLAKEAHIAICTNCHADLRSTSLTVSDENKQQTIADTCSLTGSGVYDTSILKACDWFELLRYFIGLIRRASTAHPKQLSIFFNALNIPIDQIRPSQTGLAFECLPTEERQIFLCQAWILMNTSTSDLEQNMKDAGLNQQSLQYTKYALPPIIKRLIKDLPVKTIQRKNPSKYLNPKPCPRQTVRRRWARFQRRFYLINKNT